MVRDDWWTKLLRVRDVVMHCILIIVGAGPLGQGRRKTEVPPSMSVTCCIPTTNCYNHEPVRKEQVSACCIFVALPAYKTKLFAIDYVGLDD